MIKKIALGVAAASMFASSAFAADTIKIGVVTTLTTPGATLGIQQKNAVELAVQAIGGKIAGMDVEIIFEDDAFNPQTGRTKSEKLANDPDVKFITGYVWSHVLLASKKVVLDAGKFLISANAGPSQVAGEECHQNFFSTSWQNDQTPMAMG
ncbi:MAG: ABC transporter substrate-binding protein, partial [Fimbriimonadaceae bacterium]|nr:ABC transporter substrate-binding protein [Alphaproteobacteria bacterium]